MTITPLHAQAVFHGLGGDCPCFADMLTKAKSLARKRKSNHDNGNGTGHRIVAKKTPNIKRLNRCLRPKNYARRRQIEIIQ